MNGVASAQDVVWLGRLRRALNHSGFVLFAQPIVEVATGTVVQHELLLRLTGKGGRLIAPGAFLPIAERYGLIADVDRWVLTQAAGLSAAGHAVQVNVSGGTLADPDFGACVQRELVSAGADPGLLTFEITETAMIDNEGLAGAFIRRVRSLGCRVVFDDFGSGYGGFHYLKRFRVDGLKVDREFVSDILANAVSRHVVRTVVQLATALGMQTVAEGVEDAATLDELRSLGVGYAQGYHLARPAPVALVLPTRAAGLGLPA